MRKRDVLSALVVLTGGLLALGEGPLLGVVVVLGTLLLVKSSPRPSRHLTAVMTALSR